VADLRGVARLCRGLASGAIPLDAVAAHGRPPVERNRLTGQVVRFSAIGLASTVAYLVLYVILRAGLSSFAANALSLVITAVVNTAANRRLTFGINTAANVVRHHVRGFTVFVVALCLTTGALGLLRGLDAHPSRLTEAAVLVAANLVTTAMRFVMLRGWVFRPRPIESPGWSSQETHRR
jgi:putative flippase GtrA